MPNPMLIARGTNDVCLLPRMANRHGLIAGATGTGKTVTLQVLAEHFSQAGVPVFAADIKGDLSGAPKRPAAPRKSAARRRGPDSTAEATAKSAARAAGSQLGRSITRGIRGSLFGRKR